MHTYTEDKYNMYTNYKVHVLKQNIFPNQETHSYYFDKFTQFFYYNNVMR